ncbi:MAG: hypothetical protein U5K00_09990 [Melioribacteraceae bacterium]|nr:hypothetical protein [Melioribacteraceae bacterium]
MPIYFTNKIKFLLIILSAFFLVNCDQNNYEIEKENVEEASEVIGLSFTEAERDSMLELLSEYRSMYDTLRSVKLPNDIPPAINFNPVPIGKTFDKTQQPLEFENYSETILPVNANDLAYYSIGELAYLIRTKQISSLQLISHIILSRLKEYGPKIESVITLNRRTCNEASRKSR